jgi:hypothetical protein
VTPENSGLDRNQSVRVGGFHLDFGLCGSGIFFLQGYGPLKQNAQTQTQQTDDRYDPMVEND